VLRATLPDALLFFAAFFTPLRAGATALYVLLLLLFTYVLVASITAWLGATGGARTRAGSFAVAFGIRDLCWTFAYGSAIVWIWTEQYQVVDPDASSLPYIVYALGTLLAVPLIACGILRTQLFNIDLRIRWTLKQSTLAAAMPHTRNTPEYVAFRKMQVYESAYTEALLDGGLSPKERRLLDRLRESLEISEADARAIEADCQQAAS